MCNNHIISRLHYCNTKDKSCATTTSYPDYTTATPKTNHVQQPHHIQTTLLQHQRQIMCNNHIISRLHYCNTKDKSCATTTSYPDYTTATPKTNHVQQPHHIQTTLLQHQRQIMCNNHIISRLHYCNTKDKSCATTTSYPDYTTATPKTNHVQQPHHIQTTLLQHQRQIMCNNHIISKLHYCNTIDKSCATTTSYPNYTTAVSTTMSKPKQNKILALKNSSPSTLTTKRPISPLFHLCLQNYSALKIVMLPPLGL